MLDLGTAKSKLVPIRSSPAAAIPQDANVSPVTRTAVALEYASLRYKEHCPSGMYIVPSLESVLIWDAVLFIHQGAHTQVLIL
jgi:hypothetical protein